MNSTSPKVQALRNDFAKVIASWGKSLAESKTEFTRDSAILRFELAYEVGWKLLQTLLREQGYETSSPRQAFERAFAIGWIRDEEIWDDIIQARNNAVHVYREADAEALFANFKRFHEAFEQLRKAIS
jgi:nucleotidyltransferase substrate binding protein (TIGR01987 family)